MKNASENRLPSSVEEGMPEPTATAGVVGGRCFVGGIEPPPQRRAAPLLPSLSKEGTLHFHPAPRRDLACYDDSVRESR